MEPERLQLRDGTEVVLREIELTDVEGLRALFFRLSPTTVYRRFFGRPNAPSDRALARLAGVDHDRRQAIAAVIDGTIVGVARYDRRVDSTDAEFAIVVEDAWQHHGLGHVLLRRIGREATSHGIVTVTGTVLAENRPMLDLFRQLLPNSRAEWDGYELRLRGQLT